MFSAAVNGAENAQGAPVGCTCGWPGHPGGTPKQTQFTGIVEQEAEQPPTKQAIDRENE